jgi:hypothetical protein
LKYEVFALGVGQVTLLKPEEMPNTLPMWRSENYEDRRTPLTGIPSSRDAGDIEASRPQPVYGNFNNVIVFNRKVNSFTTVFNQRIAISQFQTGWRTPQEILIVHGTDTDSNHDGELSAGDIQTLFVYTISDKQLHRVSVAGMSVEALVDVPSLDYLIVQYHVDHNHDGEIGSTHSGTGPEPAVLLRVDLKTFEATSFVPEEITRRLQTVLQQPAPPSTPDPVKP